MSIRHTWRKRLACLKNKYFWLVSGTGGSISKCCQCPNDQYCTVSDWYESLLFVCNCAMTNPNDLDLEAAACHLLNVGIKVQVNFI